MIAKRVATPLSEGSRVSTPNPSAGNVGQYANGQPKVLNSDSVTERDMANIDVSSPIRLSQQAKDIICKLRKMKDEAEDWVKCVSTLGLLQQDGGVRRGAQSADQDKGGTKLYLLRRRHKTRSTLLPRPHRHLQQQLRHPPSPPRRTSTYPMPAQYRPKEKQQADKPSRSLYQKIPSRP